MNNNHEHKKIEHLAISRNDYERGQRAAQTTFELGKMAINFSRINRVPRYPDGEPENDAEHSFMLALVAPEIAASLELELDSGLMSRYATVHDLVEIKTGDIATFQISDEQLHKKAELEHEALIELSKELPSYTAHTLVEYESQATPEARFVRYIDKLLPIVVDIVGDGERVLREDYYVTDQAQLQEKLNALQDRFGAMFGGEFPDIDRAHKLLCELLANKLYNED